MQLNDAEPKYKAGEEIELDEEFAVVDMPINAIEADVTITVYHDGEILKVGKKMGLGEIREAFKKAEDGYIDKDDVFVLTKKGEDWLDEHADIL